MAESDREDVSVVDKDKEDLPHMKAEIAPENDEPEEIQVVEISILCCHG